MVLMGWLQAVRNVARSGARIICAVAFDWGEVVKAALEYKLLRKGFVWILPGSANPKRMFAEHPELMYRNDLNGWLQVGPR